MKKATLLLVVLILTFLWGCRGPEAVSETTVPEESVETAPAETGETVTATTEETVPEAWISYEEAPEMPTRPVEVVKEQSSPEIILPVQTEPSADHPTPSNENETPLAIG